MKLNRKISAWAVVFSIWITPCQAQSSPSVDLGLNILFTSAGTAITYCCHSHVKKRGLLRAIVYGAAAGSVFYEAKNVTRLIGEKRELWPCYLSTALSQIGVSSVRYGITGKVEVFYPVGFLSLTYDNRFHIQIRPYSFISTCLLLSKYKLSPNASLESGHLVFNKDEFGVSSTFADCVVMSNKRAHNYRNSDYIHGHESVHVVQYEQFSSFVRPCWMPRFIQTDAPLDAVLYNALSTRYQHDDNPFEVEAEMLSCRYKLR